MALHRLTCVTIGVPNLTQSIAYYAEFGLTHLGDGAFSTEHGGEQLRLVHAPQRRLVQLGVGADDHDDLARIATRLHRAGVACDLQDQALLAREPVSGFAGAPSRWRRG